MFGVKRLKRQQIVERFNAECQTTFSDWLKRDPDVTPLQRDTFEATRKTIAFELSLYQLSYMRIRVRAMLTYEEGMTQQHIVMGNDQMRKGIKGADEYFAEKILQGTAKKSVYRAFFRAVENVVEK